MGSRIMKDGRIGRYQYLSDSNWTPEPYVLDYETHKRYYPSNGMNALVEILNEQDKKIEKLETDYRLGVETKLYSRRQLEADNKRLKNENDEFKRVTDTHINIMAEVEGLISFYETKINEYQKLYPTGDCGCLIKEYEYKIQALNELKSKINEDE